jgi:hypothetical protein
LIHKSELNAVKLNLKNEAEVKIAVEEIRSSFRKTGFELDEVMIQNFITTKHELLLGGYRDPSFGPVVMFGTGGKYVEYWNDTQIRSAYLTEGDIEELIIETKIGKIIQGVRGEEKIDIDRLKFLIKSIARLMIEEKEVIEIDLNPLIVDKNNNFYAVDVRIKTIKN